MNDLVEGAIALFGVVILGMAALLILVVGVYLIGYMIRAMQEDFALLHRTHKHIDRETD